MTVLSVGYPLFPVARDASGGAEQVLLMTERAVTEAGHRSIVVAAQGSDVAGELVATPVPRGQITDSERRQAQQIHLGAIRQILAGLNG